MKVIKWYTHNCYENIGSILEEVQRVNPDLPKAVQEKLANELRNHFYEIAFSVEVDEFTGKIMRKTMIYE